MAIASVILQMSSPETFEPPLRWEIEANFVSRGSIFQTPQSFFTDAHA